MKFGIVLSFLMMTLCIQAENARKIKVLHITLHEGCKKDFQEVGQELGLDLTSWFVQELEREIGAGFWEGAPAGNEIYNVGPRRAKRVWDRHKDFFNQFDVIVTSDTAPLSRIFLQNGWSKPLIIWVCNRFDYTHEYGGEDRFPDGGYYDLIRRATTMHNVRIISYTPYERVYARRRGIEFGDLCIKPLGRKNEKTESFKSAIPAHVIKKDTIFVYPRLNESERYVMQSLQSTGINTYMGVYNGPEDLEDFKGVLYFPYQWSNLALFEGLQRGLIHFVPSPRFVNDNRGRIRHTTLSEFDLCEWYAPENRDCLVYFDSWQDLKQKANQDYTELKKRCINFGIAHRQAMLSRWNAVFNDLVK